MPPRSSKDDTSTANNEDLDPQAHQGCYLFEPPSADTSTSHPSKRRKTGKNTQEAPASPPEDSNLFTPLFSGAEEPHTVQIRWDTYQRLWENQERRITDILDAFNRTTLDSVSEFVRDEQPEKYQGRIPTALVLAGPNIASHEPLFVQLASRLGTTDQAGPVVVLTSKDAPNLKAALKKLIRDATQDDEGVDDEDERVAGSKGAKLLNYDLQIVCNWCALHKGQKVIVAIQDTEAFDSGILSDLISLFSSHLDRIPFVLLLGIATSLDVFHEKIPKATIRMMKGEKFDVERADECLAQIFNESVISSDSVLKLGGPICDFLLERYRNHTQSIQAFVTALKYAYMCHFYANPLSVILAYTDDLNNLEKTLTEAHFEAIRMLPSFRRLVETKLESGDTSTVRMLLDDQEYLSRTVRTAVGNCTEYTESLDEALQFIEIGRSCLQSTTAMPRYELYAKFVQGELDTRAPLIRDFLLSVKKLNSTALISLIEKTISADLITISTRLSPLLEKIKALVSRTTVADGSRKHLTSEFDSVSSTTEALRSTAVSKKIKLAEHARSLTAADAEYSSLVAAVHAQMQEYFAATLKPLQDIFLHEVFFYAQLSPHRDVFAARSRATIERALSHPRDYLACECCEGDGEDEDPLTGTMPSTAVLYKLSLETGLLINTHDLWTAYWTLVGEGAEDEADKESALARFYRSVAEMRWMGMLKGTKKRVDHLQKVAWKGL